MSTSKLLLCLILRSRDRYFCYFKYQHLCNNTKHYILILKLMFLNTGQNPNFKLSLNSYIGFATDSFPCNSLKQVSGSKYTPGRSPDSRCESYIAATSLVSIKSSGGTLITTPMFWHIAKGRTDSQMLLIKYIFAILSITLSTFIG